jgi:putative ABC transport system substrate-binding protein
LRELRSEALVVTADPLYNGQRELLIRLAASHAIPAVYEWREFAERGGLMSYGTSITEGYRQAGVYVGKILKGARPSDLPVIQSDRFEAVLNLATAKALGIPIPQSLRLRVDELIE